MVTESYRLWLEHETRTDDISMVIVQFEPDAEGEGRDSLEDEFSGWEGIAPQTGARVDRVIGAPGGGALVLVHTRAHTHAHTRTHVHVYTRMPTHSDTHMHAPAHKHTHTCAHTHTCTRTQTHTHPYCPRRPPLHERKLRGGLPPLLHVAAPSPDAPHGQQPELLWASLHCHA